MDIENQALNAIAMQMHSNCNARYMQRKVYILYIHYRSYIVVSKTKFSPTANNKNKRKALSLQKHNNKQTMSNIINYKNFVHSLAMNGEDRIFLNSDEDKAIIVLVQLIQNTQQELRIFAGNLCNHIGDNTDYIIAISEFVERGGVVKILLNNYDSTCAKNSNLFKRLAYYIAQGKNILVKETNAKPYRTSDIEKKEIHFTVGDHMAYRIETDIEKRTAECNFNSPQVAKGIADFFDVLFDAEESQDIDIMGLFYDADR